MLGHETSIVILITLWHLSSVRALLIYTVYVPLLRWDNFWESSSCSHRGSSWAGEAHRKQYRSVRHRHHHQPLADHPSKNTWLWHSIWWILVRNLVIHLVVWRISLCFFSVAPGLLDLSQSLVGHPGSPLDLTHRPVGTPRYFDARCYVDWDLLTQFPSDQP